MTHHRHPHPTAGGIEAVVEVERTGNTVKIWPAAEGMSSRVPGRNCVVRTGRKLPGALVVRVHRAVSDRRLCTGSQCSLSLGD